MKARLMVVMLCLIMPFQAFAQTVDESATTPKKRDDSAFTPLTPTENPPRPEYPRPDFRRTAWLNLNGPWEFEVDRRNTGEKRGLHLGKTLKRTIQVPFPPESPLSGIGETDFLRHVWYHRTIQIPEAMQGQRILLHFGAVDYLTRVWINGTPVGSHRGGYTPFSFDITDALVDRIADIVVRADDTLDSGLQPTGKQSRRLESHGCVYTRATGIWQTVWLEPVPAARLEKPRIIPDLANRAMLIQPAVTRPGQGMRIVAQVKAGDTVVGEATADLNWQPAPMHIKLRKLRLWSPEDPYLYTVRLTLQDKFGRAIDSADVTAGMRSLAISGNRLLFNGKSLFQRLVLIQGYYPEGIYTAPSDDIYKKDIQAAKAMGFNGARLHMKLFDPRFLYWADRLGFLIWDEYPNWGMDHSSSAAVGFMLQEWLAAVKRDFNHPSVIGWCPFNETPAHQWREGIAMVYRMTKTLDPSRPVIGTSGFVHVATDIYDCHNYEQDPDKFEAIFKGVDGIEQPWHNNPQDAPYQGQPYMVSEYGGAFWSDTDRDGWGYGNAPKTRSAFVIRLKGLTEALLFQAGICGLCYTQLYDIEQEKNGLYTYDRKPKFDADRIRRIFTQKAAIED